MRRPWRPPWASGSTSCPSKRPFGAFLDALGPLFDGAAADVTEENIQARIRGVYLMALSNKTGSMLLTTGNKSELATGYCTLYGDMAGGLGVIGDVFKTEVYALAEEINREREVIPWNTVRKRLSAELRPNQTDQDSLPPYEVLDRILKRLSFSTRRTSPRSRPRARTKRWSGASSNSPLRPSTSAGRHRPCSR